MARFSLIPREEKFYGDFLAMADQLRIGARLLEEMFASDPPIARLRAVPGLEKIDVRGHHVSGILRGEVEPLLAAIAGQRVVDFQSREPSLEEIFLTYYSGEA